MIKQLLTIVALTALVACSSAEVKPTNAKSGFSQEGKASYYSPKLHGNKTASGVVYDHSKLTAAHKKLPFGSRVKVTNLTNKKSVVVTINDRGPFVKGRIIDLSGAAFKAIANLEEGVVKVKIQVI